MSLSHREAALAIAPKITGGLSAVASGWIAAQVLRDPKKRKLTYHRLLATMSLCDCVSSLSYFMSTWAVPQGVNTGWGNDSHFQAYGNNATCTLQGVGIQWGVTAAILSVLLSIHYLLVIRYNSTERYLRNLEPYYLGFALLIGLGLTVPGIFMNIYGNTNLWCWISPNFYPCDEERDPATAKECREQAVGDAYNNRWAFYYGPLWTCITAITLVQIALFLTVRQIEGRAARWRRMTINVREKFRQTRMVAVQAALYVTVFYITWIPYTAIAATGKFFNPHDNFGLLLLVVTCQPAQGFMNLLIYRRQQVAKVVSKASDRLNSSLRWSSNRSNGTTNSSLRWSSNRSNGTTITAKERQEPEQSKAAVSVFEAAEVVVSKDSINTTAAGRISTVESVMEAVPEEVSHHPQEESPTEYVPSAYELDDNQEEETADFIQYDFNEIYGD